MPVFCWLQNRTVSLALLLAGLACAALVLVHGGPGAGFRTGFAGGGRPCELLLCFDHSESYRPCLGGALAAAGDLAEHLNPAHDRLRCFAVDTQATPLYDNPPPESGEALQDLLASRLQRLPACRGTYPARLWHDLAECAAQADRPTAIAFFTDGDNDDPASQAALVQSVASLARNPHIVFIGIYGVTPENRKALSHAFAPFGYGRFRMYDAGESDTDLLLSRLKEAHVPDQEAPSR